MGVPLFYGRIINHYFRDAILAKKPNRVTTLALDFIGVLYMIYNDLNLNSNGPWTIPMFLHKVEDELMDLIKKAKPQELLIIAIDGLAPLGKINQQRKRRFRHALEKLDAEPNLAPFDTNEFSPGTDLTIAIDTRIRDFILRKRSFLPENVIYSSFTDVGEGEHKIMTYLRQYSKPNDVIFIHGLDADLIFLSCLLPGDQRIYLFRENNFVNEEEVQRQISKGASSREARQRSVKEQTIFFDIKEFRKLLAIRNIGIPEFVLASFFLGNDFFPYQAGFNLVQDLAAEFLKQLEGRQFADPFNLDAFLEFIDSLVDFQEGVLIPKFTRRLPLENFRDEIRFPTELIEENFIEQWNERMTFASKYPDYVQVNEETIVDVENDTETLEVIFPPIIKDVQRNCLRYLSTLLWCYAYYKDHKSVNWEWVYYPDYSPLLRDLIQHIPENVEEFNELLEDRVLKRKAMKIGIFEQLLLILPRNLETGAPTNILPEELQFLQLESSPIFDFYPRNFKIVRDGVFRESDGFTKLPPFDYFRLTEILQKLPITKKKLASFITTGPSINNRPKGSYVYSLLEQELTGLNIEVVGITSIEDYKYKKFCQVLGSEVLAMVTSAERRLFPRQVDIKQIEYKWHIIPVKRRSGL